jgi:hypothetical protein
MSSLGGPVELDNDGQKVRKTDLLVKLRGKAIVLVMTLTIGQAVPQRSVGSAY